MARPQRTPPARSPDSIVEVKSKVRAPPAPAPASASAPAAPDDAHPQPPLPGSLHLRPPAPTSCPPLRRPLPASPSVLLGPARLSLARAPEGGREKTLDSVRGARRADLDTQMPLPLRQPFLTPAVVRPEPVGGTGARSVGEGVRALTSLLHHRPLHPCISLTRSSDASRCPALP